MIKNKGNEATYFTVNGIEYLLEPNEYIDIDSIARGKEGHLLKKFPHFEKVEKIPGVPPPTIVSKPVSKKKRKKK